MMTLEFQISSVCMVSAILSVMVISSFTRGLPISHNADGFHDTLLAEKSQQEQFESVITGGSGALKSSDRVESSLVDDLIFLAMQSATDMGYRADLKALDAMTNTKTSLENNKIMHISPNINFNSDFRSVNRKYEQVSEFTSPSFEPTKTIVTEMINVMNFSLQNDQLLQSKNKASNLLRQVKEELKISEEKFKTTLNDASASFAKRNALFSSSTIAPYATLPFPDQIDEIVNNRSPDIPHTSKSVTESQMSVTSLFRNTNCTSESVHKVSENHKPIELSQVTQTVSSYVQSNTMKANKEPESSLTAKNKTEVKSKEGVVMEDIGTQPTNYNIEKHISILSSIYIPEEYTKDVSGNRSQYYKALPNDSLIEEIIQTNPERRKSLHDESEDIRTDVLIDTFTVDKLVKTSTINVTSSFTSKNISLEIVPDSNNNSGLSTAKEKENITALSAIPDETNEIAAHVVAGNTESGLDAASIAGIVLGLIAISGLVGSVGFVLYRRRYLNKPQSLNDKCSNPDSSGYIDDSTLRENSEEMYSLDNDSFLNSLEAMTIQNYWTDNVKHTKL